METTAFDRRSSLNPKGGLALLVKALTRLSVRAVQPGENFRFAGILGQKIFQAALLGSTSDPTTAAPGGKPTLPAAMKGVMSNGNGEPAMDGKAVRTTDHHPLSSTCNDEPLKGAAGETKSEMIDHSPVSEMEKPTFEEELTLIWFQPVMASSLREDAPLSLTGPWGKKSLSLTEKAEPTGDARTAIHLATAMMEQAIAIPATGESAPYADPSPAENVTRRIEPQCGPDAALLAQAVNPEEAATPASHEALPLSDRPAGHRFPLEGAERRMEPAFMQRAAEILPWENDRPATDGALDVRQASPSHRDHWKRAGESKEGASIAAAPQKSISGVGEGGAAIGQAAPEPVTPAGSPGKTLSIRDAVTEAPGPVRDHQQSRNTIPNHPMRLPERDMSLFRMEMPNVVPAQEAPPPAAVASTRIEMQAIIDQILEARQVVSNDFGRVRLLLNPPNLGTVDLDIVVRRERVDVMMTAENTTVQQALQSHADDIRIALQRQDLKIEGFQVLLQDNGMNQQQTNSGAMYRQNREHRERFKANDDDPPAFPVFSSIPGVKSAAGLVSIFA